MSQIDSLEQVAYDAYRRADYSEALNAVLQARDMADSLNNPSRSAQFSYRVADIYRATERHDLALDMIRSSLPAAMKLRDKNTAARFLNLRASVYYEMYLKDMPGMLDSLGNALREAESFITLTGLQSELGRNLVLQGVYFEKTGDFSSAINAYSRAEKIYISTGFLTDLPNIYMNWYESLHALKRFEEGLEILNKGWRIADSTQTLVYMKDLAFKFGKCYEGMGKLSEALKWERTYQNLQVQFFRLQIENQISQIRSEYEGRKQEAENQLLKSRIEQQEIFNWSAILIIILSGVAGLILLIAYREKTRAEKRLQLQKEEIETVNQQLYATNIELSSVTDELKTRAEQLHATNQVKDRLFSIISHDLRGPVNTLHGALSLLKEDDLSEEERDALMHELESMALTTSDLLNNLLYWASSQMKGFNVVPDVIDLAELVRTNVSLVSPSASVKSINLINEIPHGLSAFADPSMINLVLRNLITNAVKFTPASGSVIIAGLSGPDHVTIFIRDTGIGMQPSEIAKILEGRPLQSKYGTSNEKGVGLGLLLCREFIHANSGVFDIESIPGKGTTFRFTVPVSVSRTEPVN